MLNFIMKHIKIIVILLVLLVLGSAGSFFLYQKKIHSDQAEVACVGMMFPYVLIQDSKRELDDAISNMQKELSEEAGGAGAKDEGPKPLISKNIDAKFISVAQKLREAQSSEENTATAQESVKKDFEDIAGLFRKESPEYLKACIGLFLDMTKECGGFDPKDEAEKECFNRYQEQVTGLVSKYYSTNLNKAVFD